MDKKFNKLLDIIKAAGAGNMGRARDLLNIQRYILDNLPEDLCEQIGGIACSADRNWVINFNKPSYVKFKDMIHRKELEGINYIKSKDFKENLFKKLTEILKDNCDSLSIDEIDAFFDNLDSLENGDK